MSDPVSFTPIWCYGELLWVKEYTVLGIQSYEITSTWGGDCLISYTIPPGSLERAEALEIAMSINKYLKKALSKQQLRNGPVRAHCAEAEGRWPAIHAFLTELEGENGQSRDTATLTLFAQDGMFKTSLNDRDSGCSLWASADGLLTALDALEALLNADVVPWRGQAGERRAKKSQK